MRVRGICPHDCPDTCALITEVENGRAVAVRGDPDHPITQGWLCSKVRPYLDHVYHPDRLTHPMRQLGGKGSGRWQRITWDEASAEIAERWQAIIARDGAEAILPYSFSGTLGLIQMGAASSRLWSRLGASQLERTICGAAAETAVTMTLGARWGVPYTQVQHSQLVIIWGHNPVSTAPHFMPFLRQAQRNGCKVVVIDPRRTRTARGADWHLAPKPGSDGALALGLARLIVDKGQHDPDWLVANTVGWPELRARLDDYPVDRVAAITGLAEADIVELARLYGTTRPGLIKIADGLQRNHHGGQTVRAICALPAITGQYGRSGAGLAYSTSGHAAWRVAPVHDREQCPPPGRMVNMNRLGAALLGEVSDPPIRSLYVFGANPAAVNPHAGRVVAGMRRDDLFTVVHELFMTDTAELADILLPATSQLEQTDLHSAYGHTMLGYNTPAIAPLGESKSNWDVMRILAEALGFDEPWLRCSADEVIDEVIRATAEHSPAVRGIDLDRLRTEGSAALDVPDGPPFADGHFPTPSGKVELYCAAMNAHGLDPLPHWSPDWDDGSYDSGVASGADASGDKHMGEGRSDTQRFDPDQALDLLSGASHHFVTSSLGNQLGLLHRTGRPFVEIHPSDASARGIAHGQRVIVENGRGWCELVARVTDNVRPGVLASPKGHWSKWHGGRNINWLTSDALGDLANQSTFHSNRVWIRPSDRPEPRLYAVPGPI